MKLTQENLIDGAKKALENANELIIEANLLYDNQFYPRAFTLFQLSMEETGKAALMFTSVMFKTYKTEQEKNKLLKEIRNHKVKTEMVQRTDLVVALCLKDKKLKKTLLDNVKHQRESINKINDLKNYSLYVSDIDNSFIKPSDKIGKKLVDDFKFYAEIRLLATKQFYDFILLHLDKVIEYMSKVDFEKLAESPSPEMVELFSMLEDE